MTAPTIYTPAMVDAIDYALAVTIREQDHLLRGMRKGKARTQMEEQRAACQDALRTIRQTALLEVLPTPSASIGDAQIACVRQQVEQAMVRRYGSGILRSETDFLAGSIAVVVALFGDEREQGLEAVPAPWRDVVMGGPSLLQRISEGAD